LRDRTAALKLHAKSLVIVRSLSLDRETCTIGRGSGGAVTSGSVSEAVVVPPRRGNPVPQLRGYTVGLFWEV